MVRQDKSKPGRVTPKGTVPKGSKAVSSSFVADSPTETRSSSSDGDSSGFRQDRISDQPVSTGRKSPIYVPVLMFGALGLGFVVILVNYLIEGFLGTPNNWYLVGGLGLVLFGIIAATQYR